MDSDSICTAIQKIYDDQYSADYNSGAVYYIEYFTSSPINVKAIFPDDYTDFVTDDFIVTPRKVGTYDCNGSISIPDPWWSYDASTGSLTVSTFYTDSSGSTAIMQNWKIYLIRSKFISLQ